MIPRCRMIHTKIWISNQVTSLKPMEALLYVGMITLGDHYGRLNGEGRFLKNQVFPYWKVSISQVETMRDHIAEVGLITVYLDENGTYIHHPNWRKYQILRADRARDSEFPDPPTDNRQTSDSHVSAEVNQSEANGAETKQKITESKWNAFPSAADLMLEGMKASVTSRRSRNHPSGYDNTLTP